MPEHTVKSVRKKNEDLQNELVKLRSEFKDLESLLAAREMIAASEANGGVDGEIVKSFEFLSSEYDDLIAF